MNILHFGRLNYGQNVNKKKTCSFKSLVEAKKIRRGRYRSSQHSGGRKRKLSQELIYLDLQLPHAFCNVKKIWVHTIQYKGWVHETE